ncbi:WXG100 family type VII secretion target [Nocardia macrotermitis]|uniref:Uncharacterized protein n=1 Tax=Nocardia macrotermitis TaxID=2585198 RepID=A0A7K0D1G4_9NOCA|nr:WXG100 family type VII secretion target [Nocardia macrotermitis]MQY19556.1 hypothetical protein [Nocardia macrotermitis]
MSDILYDPATMNTLYDDLNHSGSQLRSEGSNLEDQAKAFNSALQGDNANQGFHATYTKWADEFDNHLQVLDQLQQSVEDALHRALAADSAVGQGFDVSF